MELQEVCWDLFRQNGQIGYYLLCQQLEQEEVDASGGTISERERYGSAQQGL